jgi:hypothetical protein
MVNPCPRCGGRGWLVPETCGVDWPPRCVPCRGTGKEPTLRRLASLIDEHSSALYRLDKGRAGPLVAERLLWKLHRFAQG